MHQTCLFWIAYLYLSSPKYRPIKGLFTQNSYFPPLFYTYRQRNPPLHPSNYLWSWSLLTAHQPLFVFSNNQFQHFLPHIFILSLNDPLYILLKMTWNPLNRRRTNLCSTSSREFEECLNKAGNHTCSKRNQNLYREAGSVYFYLINVNLPSHFRERNVELVKLHTGHIFIRYKIKIYSLPFLHISG